MKYTIYKVISPSIDDGGNCLLYAMRTGEFLKISESVALKIDSNSYQSFSKQLTEQLQKMKILIDDNENELELITRENSEALGNIKTFSFTIFPTQNCQLGCSYCGQAHSPLKPSPEIQHEALLYIENNIKTGKYENLHIGWFGGEPLLGLDIINKLSPSIKALTDKYQLRYSSKVVTNGLLLKVDNFLTLIANGITDICVTLDGIDEYHDKRRHTKGGEKSFDIIFNNLKTLVNQYDFKSLNVAFTIRMNVDQYNIEGVLPLIHLLKESGFGKQPIIYDIARVHSWGNDAHNRSLEREEWSKRKLEFLMELYELNMIHNITLPIRNKVVCQAVRPDARYMDAQGNLFDCSEAPLVPANSYKNDYSIGNIFDHNKIRSDIKRNFLDWNTDIENGKYPCSTCHILPLCGGSCPKEWKEGHVACPDFKENIGDYLALSYLTTKHKSVV
jgi:uncharacterized protein